MATIRTIVLPGLHGTTQLLRSFQSAAPAGFEATVWPLPTCKFASYRGLAEQMAGRLTQGARILLIAESFSGPLALMIAAEHPTRISGLVLVATFADSPLPPGAGLIPWSIVFRLPLPAFAARLAMVGPGAPVDDVHELRNAVRHVPAYLLANRLRLIRSVDVNRELAACSCPLMYIRPTADRLVPQRCLDRIMRTRPDTQVATIDGPHLILQTQPLAAWRHIANFCRHVID